ncbi:MAG: PA2779 family protein [Elusimicrobia bacterium]|nr:PA2779 family protein [Elusimicrobiota bacterium]
MLCTLSPDGWAMLAPAQGAARTGGQAYDRAADMKTVQTALESKVVRERLKTLGLTDKEIESRLTRLSDQQVHQLAKDVDTLGPGGGVVGVLIIVIVVLAILYLIHIHR